MGIGGVGVSAVARLYLAAGVEVSGTDAKDLPVLRELEAAGARTFVGFKPRHVEGAETIVMSSAIRDDNPELVEARERGLRVLHRSEGLALLMKGREAVTVAGTHGKTTTSSMITTMLTKLGADPSFAVGATVGGLGTNAAAGGGDVFVAEADESDGSFLNYEPSIAVVTNIEPDHLDHYGTPEAVAEAFESMCSASRRTALWWCAWMTRVQPSLPRRFPRTAMARRWLAMVSPLMRMCGCLACSRRAPA